jgi:hypothetical protein
MTVYCLFRRGDVLLGYGVNAYYYDVHRLTGHSQGKEDGTSRVLTQSLTNYDATALSSPRLKHDSVVDLQRIIK